MPLIRVLRSGGLRLAIGSVLVYRLNRPPGNA
jgi:hypothetical protein